MKPFKNRILIPGVRKYLDRNKRRLVLMGLIIGLLAGCTLAPEYSRPTAPVSASWPTGAAYGEEKAGAAEKLPWRTLFFDSRMRQVIEAALNHNRDLRLAILNVDKARAYYGIQRSELWPSVNAVGIGSAARVPADLSST
jgi:multidrug efflux system outer membrane protein